MKYPECLEFEKVKKFIALQCQSEAGKRLIGFIEPLQDKSEIEYRLGIAEETQLLHKEKVYYNYSQVTELDRLLFENDGQVYDYEELRQIMGNLSTGERILRDTIRYELY